MSPNQALRGAIKPSSVVVGSIVACLASALPALSQEAASPRRVGWLGALISWLPIVVVVAWFWFMRRSGIGKSQALTERSRAHMDRLEQQDEQILAALGRIEKALADGR